MSPGLPKYVRVYYDRHVPMQLLLSSGGVSDDQEQRSDGIFNSTTVQVLRNSRISSKVSRPRRMKAWLVHGGISVQDSEAGMVVF